MYIQSTIMKTGPESEKTLLVRNGHKEKDYKVWH